MGETTPLVPNPRAPGGPASRSASPPTGDAETRVAGAEGCRGAASMAIHAESANLPVPSSPSGKSQLRSGDLGGGLAGPTICCRPIISTPRKANNYKNMVSHPFSPLPPAGCCPQGGVPVEQHPIPIPGLSTQHRHPAGLNPARFRGAPRAGLTPWPRGCGRRRGGEGANVKARSGVVTRLGDRRWGRCHGITQPKTPRSAPLSPPPPPPRPSRQRAFNY